MQVLSALCLSDIRTETRSLSPIRKREQSLLKTTALSLTILEGELKSNEIPGADHIYKYGIQGSRGEAIL